MAYFDSQNGLVQFVFANEEDSYYLPSMIRTNFQRYLFYCLKKAGYEAVFYCGNNAGHYEVNYMDTSSAVYYEKIKPKSFLEKILMSLDTEQGEECTGLKTVTMVNENTMNQFINNVLDGKTKTALVFPIDVFYKFYSGSERGKKLIERKENHKSSKNLILITASVIAENSNKYITDKNGILYQLMNEVSRAVNADTGHNIYELLQLNMGEKCQYMNGLSKDMLYTIVKKQLFFEAEEGMPFSQERLEQIADVLYWYYHSEAFQRETPIDLYENEKRMYQEIEKKLQNTRVLNMINDWIDTTGEDKTVDRFHAYLRTAFPIDQKQTFIYSQDTLLKFLMKINIPSCESPEKMRDCTYRLKDFKSELEKCILRGSLGLNRDYIDTCINYMMKCQDADIFLHMIKIGKYVLQMQGRTEELQGEIWQLCQSIFKIAKNVETYDRMIKEKNRSSRAIREEALLTYNRLKEMKKNNYLSEETERENLKNKIASKEKLYKETQYYIKLLQNKNLEYQTCMDKLETAVEGRLQGNVIDIKKVLQDAIHFELKMFKEDTEEIQILKDMEHAARTNMEFPEELGKESFWMLKQSLEEWN